MSTILDSLKKSSDQRNNADGGSLDKFNFRDGNQSSSSFSKLIVLLVIALLFAGSFWVYQNYFASDANDSISVKTTDEQTLEKNKDKPTSKTEQINLNASKKEKPNSQEIKTKIRQIKQQQKQALREAHLADLNRNNSSFVKKSEEDIYEKIKAQRSLVKTNKYKTDENKTDKIKQKNVQPTVQKENENIVQKSTTPTQQYRLLYQLPFSIRKEVPEIKLNIHVYDELPENRIAIINGTRFAINDMVTDQILLKDILVNGILLDFDGNEFFIPN